MNSDTRLHHQGTRQSVKANFPNIIMSIFWIWWKAIPQVQQHYITGHLVLSHTHHSSLVTCHMSSQPSLISTAHQLCVRPCRSSESILLQKPSPPLQAELLRVDSTHWWWSLSPAPHCEEQSRQQQWAWGELVITQSHLPHSSIQWVWGELVFMYTFWSTDWLCYCDQKIVCLRSKQGIRINMHMVMYHMSHFHTWSFQRSKTILWRSTRW